MQSWLMHLLLLLLLVKAFSLITLFHPILSHSRFHQNWSIHSYNFTLLVSTLLLPINCILAISLLLSLSKGRNKREDETSFSSSSCLLNPVNRLAMKQEEDMKEEMKTRSNWDHCLPNHDFCFLRVKERMDRRREDRQEERTDRRRR